MNHKVPLHRRHFMVHNFLYKPTISVLKGIKLLVWFIGRDASAIAITIGIRI